LSSLAGAHVCVGRIWSDLVERPGSVTTLRYRLRHGNGSWMWVEATGTNLLHVSSVARW